ncbi:unnamed protein product [Arctia plantaginis]|uniref:Peptidase S1 domain-containing protein n=1 Tax=Arctia plantaginis TaxID=874455 RepID=A0A8S0Z386_ARCPL|nr:unnamed protein product [Arctia plantaginis]
MIENIFKIVTSFSLLISVSSTQDNEGIYLRQSTRALRLIEGETVTTTVYDYVIVLASIIDQEVHRKCTASILTSRWVLTAAHCVEAYQDPVQLARMYIWYKNFTVSPLETKFYSKILEIFIHPHYVYSYNNDQLDFNDIALVRVRSVLMDNYGQLLATDYLALLGHEVTFIGGGQTEKRGFIDSDDMQPLRIGRGVLMTCDKNFLQKMSFPLICVAPRCENKKQTAWYGDAGAPLIHDNKIIAVLVTITPTVVTAYVPVSPYLHWIYNVIETHKNSLYSINKTRF